MSVLAGHLEDYLRLRRGLGAKLDQPERDLEDFTAAMDAEAREIITVVAAVEWAARPLLGARQRFAPSRAPRRIEAVRGFAAYLRAIDERHEIPPTGVFRHRRERRTPHIWSHAETGALMGALGRLRRFDRHVTYTALFGLLASTGMRVGEALHLTRGDVDLDSGMITVTWGKTRNPRLVPLHPTTAAALRDYDQRKPVARQRGDGAAFFARQDGQALPYCNALYAFHHACADAGLADVEPAPRVHDLRHTFAVNTLLGWCRQHADLPAKMPVLSAYLGHVNPASTYWYLTAIPELMGLAADLLAENGAPLP